MQAPELQVSEWFNTDKNLKLSDFQGRVVLIEAFQMLCQGCVLHGIPLAQAVQEHFSREHVAVIGLHTVFEHHDAMTPVSLKAFLHEYRIKFPVAIDKQGTAFAGIHGGIRNARHAQPSSVGSVRPDCRTSLWSGLRAAIGCRDWQPACP